MRRQHIFYCTQDAGTQCASWSSRLTARTSCSNARFKSSLIIHKSNQCSYRFSILSPDFSIAWNSSSWKQICLLQKYSILMTRWSYNIGNKYIFFLFLTVNDLELVSSKVDLANAWCRVSFKRENGGALM